MREEEYVLALSLIPGIGGKAFFELMRTFKVPSNVFQAPLGVLLGVPGIGRALAGRIQSTGPEKVVEREIKLIKETGVSIVTLMDDGYPLAIKELPSPPLVLYLMGRKEALEGRCITVVGTRRASRHGIGTAKAFSKILAEEGWGVVSGLARGIDTAAHEGALEAGITIAFLGSGLANIYPPENRDLVRRILKRGGTVVSPFPMETLPERGNFPRRNLLMAAFSMAVLVVEAGEKSGALMTAQYAREMGKPLFAVPGPIGYERTRGVHRLIREGALLVESPEEVLEILSPGSKKRGGREEMPILGAKEMKVWEALEEGPLPVEVIYHRCSLTLQEAYELLLQMELKGVVTSIPGSLYERKRS